MKTRTFALLTVAGAGLLLTRGSDAAPPAAKGPMKTARVDSTAARSTAAAAEGGAGGSARAGIFRNAARSATRLFDDRAAAAEPPQPRKDPLRCARRTPEWEPARAIPPR
jgi:hypothetical protein